MIKYQFHKVYWIWILMLNFQCLNLSQSVWILFFLETKLPCLVWQSWGRTSRITQVRQDSCFISLWSSFQFFHFSVWVVTNTIIMGRFASSWFSCCIYLRLCDLKCQHENEKCNQLDCSVGPKYNSPRTDIAGWKVEF